MKKKIKKIISNIIPSGKIKNKVKCIWYNFFSNKKVSFSILENNIYRTKYNDITILSLDPLYSIVKDFDFYQNFYKIKEGDIVIDAGANVGYLSILFSKISKNNGKIIAFEPDRLNINSFNKNVKINEGSENIIIEDLLLWNKNTEIDFYEAGSVGSSALWIPENVTTVKKKAITIDSYLKEKQISKLDFIKMDIEGAEIEAIEGCLETIKLFKPNFAIASYHVVDNQPTYIKLEEFFKKINYSYKTIKFNKSEIITFARSNQF